MKTLFLLFLSLNFVSCAALGPQAYYSMATYAERGLASEEKIEWDIDPKNKAQMETFWVNYKECSDFAFKSKVMGSKYFETDIHTGCLKRRGYKTRKVVASK